MRHSGAPLLAGTMVAASCVLLVACGRSTPVDLASIRAEVSALPAPAGWAPEGGMHYACESINLDCTNTSSGRGFRTSAPVSDACSALATWVTTTPAFVDPVAVVRLTTWIPPTSADCVSEMTARGRYLIKAGGPSGASSSSGLGWQVLMTPDPRGPHLSVILGDPPEPLPGLGS